MYKGALILTVGGIIGAVIGVLAGVILGFFGGAVFTAVMSDKDKENEINYRSGGSPGHVIYKGMHEQEKEAQPDEDVPSKEPTPET